MAKLKKIYQLSLFLLIFISINSLYAQEKPNNKPTGTPLQVGIDTLKSSRKDTLPKKQAKDGIKTTIFFKAKDSIVSIIPEKAGVLYGNSEVKYGDTKLNSDIIRLNWGSKIVKAMGRKDSTGKVIGKPVIVDGAEKIEADTIVYNLDTQRAIIYGTVTKQGEGFITGQVVKKQADGTMHLSGGFYTTCDLVHPHFGIRAKKIKLTKNQNVVAGPFNLEIMGIPTPLGFLFGAFPKPKQKTSGVIVPTYGEAQGSGFYLRGGGYYWAINDYVDLTSTIDLYSYGNWGAQISSKYTKRYRYGGNFALNYSKIFTEVPTLVERDKQTLFSVSWSHTPVSRGTGRFSASVNVSSSKFSSLRTFGIQNQLTNTQQSTISYSKTFKGTPFNLSLSGRHNQENSTNVINITLPDFNFSVNRLTPLKGITKSSFLDQIGVSYTLGSRLEITNRVSGTSGSAGGLTLQNVRKDSIYKFNGENLSKFLQNSNVTFTHAIPISAPFKVLRYFNGSASFNFNQIINTQKYQYTYLGGRNYKVDTVRSIGSTYNYNFGVSLATNVYGFYRIKAGKLQVIRHVIQPNVSLSYAPDFSKDKYGFYAKNIGVFTQNTDGTLTEVKLPLYANTPGAGENGSISFSVRNTFEAKLRPKVDSAGAKSRKLMLLDELSFSGGYNLLADIKKGQRPLSTIGITARTRIASLFDLSFNASLDPYGYKDTLIKQGDKVTSQPLRTFDYAWKLGQGIGTITNYSIAVNTSLNPDVLKGKKPANAPNAGNNLLNNALNNPLANPLAPNATVGRSVAANNDVYIDFDIPWNLSINYNITYTRFADQKFIQTLSFSGDVALTKKWRTGFTSGYDFVGKGITTSQLNLARDLHCWEMRFDWVPFGLYRSYNFTINVKSTLLRDLKVDRKRTWYDR